MCAGDGKHATFSTCRFAVTVHILTVLGRQGLYYMGKYTAVHLCLQGWYKGFLHICSQDGAGLAHITGLSLLGDVSRQTPLAAAVQPAKRSNVGKYSCLVTAISKHSCNPTESRRYFTVLLLL